MNLDILNIIQALAVTFGGLFALWTYHKEAKRRRSEWIYRLYTQFYESDRFKAVRRLVDYAPQEEIERLTSDISEDEGSQMHEDFVDYLNFFEFIAIQKSYGNIKTFEILDMFEYYLKRLRDQGYIIAYIDKYGYEHLGRLLRNLDRT